MQVNIRGGKMFTLSLIMLISFFCLIIGLYTLIITAGFGFWLKYTLLSGLTFIVSIILGKVIDNVKNDDIIFKD